MRRCLCATCLCRNKLGQTELPLSLANTLYTFALAMVAGEWPACLDTAHRPAAGVARLKMKLNRLARGTTWPQWARQETQVKAFKWDATSLMWIDFVCG